LTIQNLQGGELEITGVNRRVVFSCLCIFLGYSLFGTFALSLRFPISFPVEAYWLSFVFVIIPILIDVAFGESSSKLRLVYLVSFSLMIHLQYAVVDSSPLISSLDAIADYRLTNTIIADSRWFTEAQSPLAFEYGFYPITNFVYLTFSQLTGMPLLIVVKYLFIVKALVVPPIIYKWFKWFFDRNVSYLATVLFLASPGAILFPHKESFAVIFFFIGIYASTKFEKTRQYLLIGLVSTLTLIMTHHFTTYVFLILLTSLFLGGQIIKRQKTVRVSTQFFMVSWVVFVAWITFIAWAIISRHQSLFFKAFFQNVLSGELTFSELMPLYAPYETTMIWLGYAVTVVSAGIGFIYYTRNRKSRSLDFLAITSFLIPLLFVATILRFVPSNINVIVSHRAYEFGYILIGAMSAFFFIRVFPLRRSATFKALMVCVIPIMIIIGPMAGAVHPRTFARVSDVVSFQALSLDAWINDFSDHSEYIIGDKLVRLIVSGYGGRSVVTYSELFVGEDFSLPPDENSSSTYVVTYVYMIDFYGIKLAKFDSSPYFHNVYSNNILNVYRIGNRTLLSG